MNFLNILYFLILLSLIILIHEAGHLFAAKKFGVYCYEFSFGMGPVIFKRKKKETQYSIRALPIGGFVSMAGEEDGDEAYPDVKVPDDRRLTNKKPWQKIIIMLAGVFMNFVLAWVIFSLIILAGGSYSNSPEPVVDKVVAGSPAEEAGFEEGDRIIKIVKEDGSSVEPDSYIDMQSFTSAYSGTETYTVERDGKTLTLTVTPEYNDDSQSYIIGITGPDATVNDVNILNCWWYGIAEMGMIVKLLMTTLAGLIFHGSGLSQLSGPVGIYQASSEYASMGFAAFMFLVAELSLNVGIMNLLPLPVLDGGQVIITLVEWIAHRELNQKVKTGIMIACWVLLIGLMVFVTWNDISKLIAG
jgi:regulator of sigma E protease